MLGVLLVLLDSLAAGVMVLGHFGFAKIALIYATIYFLVKLFFFRDILTIIDAVAGVYCLFLFFGAATGLTWLFLGYFLYKALVWISYAYSH